MVNGDFFEIRYTKATGRGGCFSFRLDSVFSFSPADLKKILKMVDLSEDPAAERAALLRALDEIADTYLTEKERKKLEALEEVLDPARKKETIRTKTIKAGAYGLGSEDGKPLFVHMKKHSGPLLGALWCISSNITNHILPCFLLAGCLSE